MTDGGYQTYLRERKRRALQESVTKTKAGGRARKQPADYREKKGGLNPFEAARRAAELEARIENLERNLSEISRRLDEASLAGDAGSVRQLGLAYSRAEAELEAALEEWGEVVG